MLRKIYDNLSPAQRSRFRGWYHKSKVQLVRRFLSYDSAALKARLADIGIRRGDTLLVHSAYGPQLGFRESPGALIDAFVDSVGARGNLLMVSMPYFSSTSDYLKTLKVFD